MLENYTKDKFGVIHQISHKNFDYDFNYIHSSYDTYGNINRNMSCLRLGYIVGVINKYPESILDVGYGNGDFLSLCEKNIKSCYGNDISGYQIPENCKFIDDIFSQEFEVITFFDVLEHFNEIDFVSNLRCKYIVISLPWCHYFSDEWFSAWKHRKENEHLHHFNDISLVEFMKNSGFECVSLTNVEDIIRKPIDKNKNILTGIFKKII
jgi:hypothetical protein